MTTRSRTSTPVEYEDFLPKSEWNEESGSHILVLYLPPEFKKEQIRITYVQSTRMIRVNGERPLVNNKWSRFNKAFQVPQNCDVNKIEARYQNGVLTLTMPQTRSTTPQPAIATKTEPKPPRQVTPPPQVTAKEPASTTPLKQANDKTTTMTPTAATTQTPRKPPLEPEPPKAVESVWTLDDLKDRTTKKSQEETISEVAPTKDSPKRKDDASFPQEDESSKKRKEKVVVEDGDDEESGKKRKEYAVKSAGLKKENDEDKALEDFIVQKVKQVKNLANVAKRNIQEFSMEVNEDRQALVNIGVAVLVIVVLGTYIYYSRGSSRTA